MSSEDENESADLEGLDQRNLRAVVLLAALAVGVIAVVLLNQDADELPPVEPVAVTAPTDQPAAMLPPARTDTRIRAFGHSGAVNIFDTTRRFIFCWDAFPSIAKQGTIDTGASSNIRRIDYAGAQSCAECHESNFESWSKHPHRFMNALATPEFVKGDFSGQQTIDYLGGTGTFTMDGDQFRMVLEKDGQQWIYQVRRTIGSRHFQYYLGILLAGTAPDDAPRQTEDHVLPFGYWIKEKKWVPTVHVFREEDTDHEEEDPYGKLRFLFYDRNCAACHTTPPFGEWVLKSPSSSRMTEYAPRGLFLHVAGLINEAEPGLFARGTNYFQYQDSEMAQILGSHQDYVPNELGVTCEACHHGCKDHESESTKTETKSSPAFSAISPHLRWKANSEAELRERSRENVNLICARCHSGKRPTYANGAHTWNSTEYADAVRGSCYDPARARAEQMNHLTCVTCHNPHKATGYEWPLTEQQNDQKCLDCHQQFKASEKLVAHTHHAAGSTGSRCMNCHNPRINEGLEKMVHTHRIFSPTDRDMIEANHPNACNLCHLEKPIDWTLTHLRDWYGEEHVYSEEKLNANYVDRQGPVAAGWLQSRHSGTRIAASAAVTREGATWAYPLLVDLLSLDDTLVNRQFTARNLEQRLGIDLQEMGYRFYMEPDERRTALAKLRNDILAKAKKN